MDHQDSPPHDDYEKENTKAKKPKTAMTWVQNYLSRRAHSEKELFEKLLKKEFSAEQIILAIEYAKERKWVTQPEELTEKVYLEWDLKNKNHQWICSYLDKKGIPYKQWNSSREAEKAAYHISEKFAKINDENYQRASTHAASRGFSFIDFKNAVELLKDES